LLKTNTTLIAAYYDENRRLTVAQRDLAGGPWHYRKLDVTTDWDSHKYITMTLDSLGRLHLAANMHVSPLVYFMSDTSGNISSLARVTKMVNPALEQHMTYPGFMHSVDGRLIYKYRDGESGDGNEIYNVFDAETAEWTPLLTTPLLDGEGKRNAYSVGPIKGPDGYFHLVWVWRDSYKAETNHDLTYARSRDLVHWETSSGKPLTLPLTFGEAEVVDPVPVHGGIINGNTMIGFDNENRVVISYHKFDAFGNTQVYVARHEKSGWHIIQVTHWKDFRWDFKGGGTLDFEVELKPARPLGHGEIGMEVNRQGQQVDYRLKDSDLSSTGVAMPETTIRSSISKIMPVLPQGMELNMVSANDSKQNTDANYNLVWATFPPHEDRPLNQVPAPTDLMLVTLSTSP